MSYDLFSYFSDSGSVETEPASSNNPENINNESNENVDSSSRAAHSVKNGARLNVSKENRTHDSDCSDRCDGEADSTDDFSDDEREALEDDSNDDSRADALELAGKSAGDGGTTKSTKASAAGTSKEVKKPEFNRLTSICYAGTQVIITKYFAEEKLDGLELEEIRKRLEKDYPEMSKQRTRMDYDEKKNIIVPMITGGKKGAFFIEGTRGFFYDSKELFENHEPINYLAALNGCFEVRVNPIGVFVVETDKSSLMEWNTYAAFEASMPADNLLETVIPGFLLKLPKIPEILLAQLASFFMDYTELNVEVMGVFYFDTENQRYFLDIPYQTVSKVSVDPSYTSYPPHIIKVAEIHSHNTMRADFSSIDDMDELGTLLYGVLGKMIKDNDHIRFDIRTRASVSGRFIPLAPQTFIDSYLLSYSTNNRLPYVKCPEFWYERVEIAKKGVLQK